MAERSADPFAEYDAAYVLGSLTPAERAEYEEHLAGCPDCRAAVDAFAGLPGLMSRVPREEVTAEPVEPPPELLPRLLAVAARRRRRTRWAVASGGAVAAAVCLVLALLLATGPRGTAPTPGPDRPMAAVARAPVRATVALTDRPWGTDVRLRCRYTGSAPYAAGYALVVIDANGAVDQVSTWDVMPGVTTTLTGTTAVHAGQIRSIQVRDGAGRPVLSLRP